MTTNNSVASAPGFFARIAASDRKWADERAGRRAAVAEAKNTYLIRHGDVAGPVSAVVEAKQWVELAVSVAPLVTAALGVAVTAAAAWRAAQPAVHNVTCRGHKP